MKKIFLVLVFSFFLTNLYATTVVTCPTDTSEIENQISNHWEHSGASWYASWAQVPMGKIYDAGILKGIVNGTGGVRGPMNNQMPHAQNLKPVLHYESLILQNDTDRGEIEIDCQYAILHNQDVFDRTYPSIASLDNTFWMKVFLFGDTSQCRETSGTTVICS